MIGPFLIHELLTANIPWSDCDILQFSGHIDSGKKELYEGDIILLQGQNSFGSIETKTIRIRWCENHGGFEVGTRDIAESDWIPLSSDEGKYVGNIYENRDLLPANEKFDE